MSRVFLLNLVYFVSVQTLYHVFNCTTNRPNLKGVKILHMLNKFGFIRPFCLCLVKDNLHFHLISFTQS
jgi:hypothetical protein